MKISTFLIFISVICFQFSSGQANKKLKENEAIQTTIRFDNPISKAEAIAKLKSKFKLEKSNNYVPTYSNTDETGRTHSHFQQYYKNLKVEFGVIITHSFENQVYMINGEIYNAAGLNVNPTISNVAALNVILNSKSEAKYLWDSKEDAAAMDYEKTFG